jgi:peptidyl-prolyl cis-trans isomerase C
LKRSLAAALLLVLPLSLACRKQSAAPATASPGTSGTAATPAGQPAPGAPAAPAAVKPVPAQLPDVVATVNGDKVQKWELESALHQVEARAGQPIPADRRDEIVRSVLDQVVTFHVLAEEARARNLQVTDADVAARMAQMRSGFPNEDAFKQALAAQNVTVEQLQWQTRMSLAVQKVVDTEVTSKIAVDDQAVGAFYQQNIDRFKQGESVHASHILVTVPQNATPADKAKARAKAEQILKKVRGGADFAAVARAESQDPGSAPNGGDLGFFPKGQMDPAFEQAAFALKPGAVSGVVESQFGFHIIKVFEKKAPHTTPLAEVEPRIKEFLTAQQREAKLDEFVAAAKKKLKIEILV